MGPGRTGPEIHCVALVLWPYLARPRRPEPGDEPMVEPDTTRSDPETVLQALREYAAEETAEADALTADVKSLNEAIAALTKRRDDIDKADLAYQKADPPKAIAAIQAYGEQKRSC